MREVLRSAPVSLMIKKLRLRWFGHVEHKDDNDWIELWKWKWKEPNQRDIRERHDGMVSRRM